jgi:membrane protein
MRKYAAIFREAFTAFNEDKVPRLGAALAFYTIFSIAPLLLIAIAIAGLVFGKEAVQGQVFAQLRGVLGESAAKMVQTMVANAAKPKSGTIATVLGVVTLILGASGVFGELKDALNTIWRVEPKKNAGIVTMIKARFLSLAMVLGTGFLLLVSLLMDSAIAIVGKYADSHLPGGEAVWQIVEQLVSLAIVTVLFAAIFRFLPDIKIAWHDVWFGAVFTSVFFVIGKFALGIYFGKSAVGSAYGAAGSLVLLLLWVYYSAQILLFGAEVARAYALAHGHAGAGRASARQRETEPTVGLAPAQPYGGRASARLAEAEPESRAKAQPASARGGFVKLAAGLVVGLLLGGIGMVVMVVKSLKKLVT